MTLYLFILRLPTVLFFFEGYSKERRFFEKGKGGGGDKVCVKYHDDVQARIKFIFRMYCNQYSTHIFL